MQDNTTHARGWLLKADSDLAAGWQPPDDLPFYYNEGSGLDVTYVPSFKDNGNASR